MLQHSEYLKSAAIGGISGACETTINQPLWSLKTRKQCGAPFTLKPSILYKGYTFGVSMMAGITAYRFTCARNLCTYSQPLSIQHAMGAVGCGLSCSFITAPIELALTYKQVLDHPASGQNIFKLYASLVKRYGVRSAFTGMPAVACRDGLNSFGQFFLVPFFKTKIMHANPSFDQSSSIAAGMTAGISSAILSHPFDTIKSLEHAQFKSSPSLKRNTMQIAWSLYKEDGLTGFYRGFGWRAARVVSGTTIISLVASKLQACT